MAMILMMLCSCGPRKENYVFSSHAMTLGSVIQRRGTVRVLYTRKVQAANGHSNVSRRFR
jgi:hypothetical protein